jgi:hypothetical protein
MAKKAKDKRPRFNVNVQHVKSAAPLDGRPGWRVRVMDEGKATNYFLRQSIAIQYGRERCEQLVEAGKLAELQVFSKTTGRLRYRNSYPRSSDPRRYLN